MKLREVDKGVLEGYIGPSIHIGVCAYSVHPITSPLSVIAASVRPYEDSMPIIHICGPISHKRRSVRVFDGTLALKLILNPLPLYQDAMLFESAKTMPGDYPVATLPGTLVSTPSWMEENTSAVRQLGGKLVILLLFLGGCHIDFGWITLLSVLKTATLECV